MVHVYNFSIQKEGWSRKITVIQGQSDPHETDSLKEKRAGGLVRQLSWQCVTCYQAG